MYLTGEAPRIITCMFAYVPITKGTCQYICHCLTLQWMDVTNDLTDVTCTHEIRVKLSILWSEKYFVQAIYMSHSEFTILIKCRTHRCLIAVLLQLRPIMTVFYASIIVCHVFLFISSLWVLLLYGYGHCFNWWFYQVQMTSSRFYWNSLQ